MAERRGKLVKAEEFKKKTYLEVQEYPWKEFTEDSVLFTDNARKNIVRASAHLQEELDQKIKRPAEFDKIFANKSKMLMPADLNEDYERTQHEMMMRKRKRLLDDEELFNLEMADMGGTAPSLVSGWTKRHEKGEAPHGAAETHATASPAPSAVSAVSGSPATSPLPANSTFPNARASASTPPAGHSANPVPNPVPTAAAEPPHFRVSELSHRSPELNETVLQNQSAFLDPALVNSQSQASQTTLEEAKRAGYEEGLREGREVGRMEGMEHGQKAGFAVGQSQGFEFGVREGETKGLMMADQKSDRFAELTTKTLAELEYLRKNLLLAGQDIFVEIANLASEKLLRAKLKSSDTALKSLFTSAVEMYSESHKLSLEVSEADAIRVKSVLAEIGHSREVGTSRLQLKVNPHLETGDFRIESDAEIMSHDLKKSIADLVESLRSELFETESTNSLKKTS